MTHDLPDWLNERLVCPRDRLPLMAQEGGLLCPEGHSFSGRDGIPVLLLADQESTHPQLEPTGESKEPRTWKASGPRREDSPNRVDEYVQEGVVGTCGNFYKPLVGNLSRYPIPEVQIVPPDGHGMRFLDIGCNWGRWSVAAARLGYDVVGVDPFMDALRAARRVSRHLDVDPNFLAADARWLPFANDTFDVVFSYSVLQHFRKPDVRTVLDEISRVLVPGGLSVVEMPTATGLRNLYVRGKRKLTRQRLAASDFHVRYWSLRELIETFTRHVGPTRVEPDSFFFINGQPADRDLLPPLYRVAISTSEIFKKATKILPPLTHVADSVYLASRKGVPGMGDGARTTR